MLTLDQLDSLDPAHIPELVTQLGEDGLPGQVAAWALGSLGAIDAVTAAIPDGRLDTRHNGYQALAVAAALGKAPAGLAGWLIERIDAEIAKARGGGTGLAEQAARPLAVLGHPQFADLVQRIIEGDRFCDRFELDRLKGAVADDGRARFLAKELAAPWRVFFADHLPKPEEPKPAPAPAKPPVAIAKPVAAKPPLAGRAPVPPPMAPIPTPVDALADDDALDDADAGDLPPDLAGLAEAEAVGDGPKPEKIDWKEFAASPEFTALNPQAQGLVTQLGPLLEQLAAQAIRAFLTDLQAQEFAALLLQVLPQALQPQAVQMALHPHALNGYQALARYLQRTGKATQGDSLVEGVKLVRQQLRDQMRKAGMIGGPDYSDPEQAEAAT